MTSILAIDTSQQWCSVALSVDDRIVAHSSQTMSSGQTEALLPAIHKALEEARQDLDCIVTITGPGSFTGLRVGLATAQGMGLALGIPVIGIDTFHAYVACLQLDRPCLVAIDSQKQDIYCQLFDASGNALNEAVALLPETLNDFITHKDIIVTGTAMDKAIAILEHNCTPAPVTPDILCQNLCKLAEKTSTHASPFYLKEAQTTPPKGQSRKD